MNPIAVCILIAFAVPALAGALALLASGHFPHPLTAVTAGTLVVWAVMEICIVPLIRLRASFRGSILVFWTALVLVIFLLGLAAARRLLLSRKKKKHALKAEAEAAGKGIAAETVTEAGNRREPQTMAGPARGTEPEMKAGPATKDAPPVEADPKAKAPADPSAGQGDKRDLWERFHDLIFLIPLILVLIMVIRGSILYRHTDDDDTRFVVNAVDMVRTDKMLLTNPATGNALKRPIRELRKDAIAPWAFYIAMLSEMTGLKASVIAHTFLPCILSILITCALFALGRTIFEKERWKIYAFVTVAWLVNLFGYYSIYSAEAFVMGRLWQGKAVLAGFGIPVLLEIFFRIYNKPDTGANYVWLCVAVVGLALLSSQSIILTSAAAAFFALAYAIALRKPVILLKMGAACVPNLILLAAYALM